MAADEGREDVRSPSFNYHEELDDKEMKCTLPFRKNTTDELQELKQKIVQLERENKVKSKFIESVYDMRRKLEGTTEDCSLKDLWRWLKKLPHH